MLTGQVSRLGSVAEVKPRGLEASGDARCLATARRLTDTELRSIDEVRRALGAMAERVSVLGCPLTGT